MYEVDSLYLALVMEKIEKSDPPKGVLIITRPSTEPVPGPFTGIEY